MSLQELFASLTARGETAAYLTQDSAISFATISSEAAAWRTHLLDRPEHTWGLHIQDTRAFAPLFLGLLSAGKSIRLLPHVQVGLINELQSELDGLIIDEDYVPTENITVLSSPEIPESSANATSPVTAMQELAFFTSGSTGEGKMFLKKFEQLLAEVEVQDALWGDPAGKSGVCATVSHQHIYGFLFKFLWPLITGRTVWSDACFYPADIQDAVVQLKQCTLVSTPSHLKRLPALLDWSVVRGACTAIFSSGGPLPESAAVEVQFGLGQAPREIFGSTETGGVAWRQLQKAGEACAWTPFPGIHIRQESDTGCLQVASPFIHPSELSDGWYTMQDSIALEASGCFHLKGRVDRIVKIEQKRVSLEHMEQRLMQLDGIDDAAVALLSDGTAQSGRSRLGAAIVLSESGLQQADALSSSQLNDHIKQHLLAWFEPTVLPRAFVFVDRLPENAQGKKPLAEIRALFNKKDNPESTLPSICSEETDDHSVTLQCEVPADLVYFDGHFDALPVVAGVVQIHWAMKLAEQYFGVTVNATQLEAIKFHKLLFPRDRFTLSLRHSNEPEKIHFSLAQGENKFSSGRVAI